MNGEVHQITNRDKAYIQQIKFLSSQLHSQLWHQVNIYLKSTKFEDGSQMASVVISALGNLAAHSVASLSRKEPEAQRMQRMKDVVTLIHQSFLKRLEDEKQTKNTNS